ncbi:MAG: response regulator [Planctomycetota bacterium]|nr:response regulator [Planctomycetota bacterium]
MATITYFAQACPTCGRNLRVRHEYLGRQVVCQHCGGQFQACDTSGEGSSSTDVGSDIMRRAEELLDSVKLRRDSVQSP